MMPVMTLVILLMCLGIASPIEKHPSALQGTDKSMIFGYLKCLSHLLVSLTKNLGSLSVSSAFP